MKHGILLSRAQTELFKCFCFPCPMKCGHQRKYSWLISSGRWLPIMRRGGDFYNFFVGVMFILGKNSLDFDGHLNSFRPFSQLTSHIEFLFLLVVRFNLSRFVDCLDNFYQEKRYYVKSRLSCQVPHLALLNNLPTKWPSPFVFLWLLHWLQFVLLLLFSGERQKLLSREGHKQD